MIIGNKIFDTDSKTYIMGILNVTPDSFSDGGRYNSLDKSFYQAERMISEGADILDVGGESTRPGYVQISEMEEIERVLPVIEGLKMRFDVPISVDTYKSKVAKVAINAGADLINDIWGLKYDHKMASVIAESGVACCLMHNREDMSYHDFVNDVLEDLRMTLRIAKEHEISDDKIMLDPGIGFAKTYEMNLEMIKQLQALKQLGYPILLGTSRKSVIGLTLDLPVTEREEGTIATTVLGMMKGCSFVRVHDVKSNYRAIKMAEAVMREHKLV